MKKILLLAVAALFISCKEEPESVADKTPEFLSVEVDFDDGPSKDLIINLKEKYYVYANSRRIINKDYTIGVDTIFRLDNEEVTEIIERYKKVDMGSFYNIEDGGKMHTRIECIFTDKTFHLLQDGTVRTAGQREFMRILLAVLMTKTEDQMIFLEITKMFGGMAEFG